MARQLMSCAGLCTCGFVAIASSVAHGDVFNDWNQRFLQTIREASGIPVGYPGPISRAGAMLYTAMYDATNSIDPTYEPYLSLMTCPPDTSADAAIAQAAHDVLVATYPYPQQIAKFDALLAKHLAAIPSGKAKREGITVGSQCAAAIVAARAFDGSQIQPPYVPGSAPGDWQPTFPDYTGPASPHWPDVQPWCMTSGSQFRLPGPGGFTSMVELLASDEWVAEFNEVKELGSLFSATRTEYETETAFFWANDRTGTCKPPGHLLDITQIVATDQGLDVKEKTRLFALVALGMADAGIAAWDTKYATDIDLWRPIHAIQSGDGDGNPQTIGDPAWLALSYDPSILVFTPPFPAWVSGHATFGAVHAAIMRGYFQTDEITFTITSDDAPGVWRTYHRFSDAAKENGLSRLFFGVHWRWDATDGYTIGTNLGDYISTHFLRRLGDLNGDQIVDQADLAIFLGSWGHFAGEADLNHDGDVGSLDLAILLGNWG